MRSYTRFFEFSEKSYKFSFEFRHFLLNLNQTGHFKASHLTFDLDFQLFIYKRPPWKTSSFLIICKACKFLSNGIKGGILDISYSLDKNTAKHQTLN